MGKKVTPKLTALEKRVLLSSRYLTGTSSHACAYWVACMTDSVEEFAKGEVYDEIEEEYMPVSYSIKIPQKEIKEFLLSAETREKATASGITWKKVFKYHEKLAKKCPPEEFSHENLDDVLLDPYNECRVKALWEAIPEDRKVEFLPAVVLSHPRMIPSDEMTEETIITLIELNPEFFENVKPEQITQKMLYKFLEKSIHTGYVPSESSLNKVPEYLTDNKVFQQGQAMASPCRLRLVKEEYKSKALIDYCQKKLLSADIQFGNAEYIAKTFPEEYMTDEIAARLVAAHFYAVRALPEKFLNEHVFNLLIEAGKYSWIDVVDLTKVSEETIIRAMGLKEEYSSGWFWDGVPKGFWTKNTAKAYARYSNQYFKDVPKSLQIPEDMIANAECANTFSELPADLLTDEVVEKFLEKGMNIWPSLDDKFKTREKELEYYQKKLLPYKALSEDLKNSEEVIQDYLDNAIEKINFEDIPMNLVTEKVLRAFMAKSDTYHFNQGNQDERISNMLYDLFLEEGGYDRVASRLYMLPYISDSRILDFLKEKGYITFLSGFLYSHYRTEEILDLVFEYEPDSYAYMEMKYRDKYRNIVNGGKTKEKITEEAKIIPITTDVAPVERVSQIPDEIIETCEQLSLFDLFLAS